MHERAFFSTFWDVSGLKVNGSYNNSKMCVSEEIVRVNAPVIS
jgi:hypothetical protein